MARRVPLDSELDLGVELAQLARNLKVSPRQLPISMSQLDEILEDSHDLWICLGIPLLTCLILKMLIDPIPANPFPIVPDTFGRILQRTSCHRTTHRHPHRSVSDGSA